MADKIARVSVDNVSWQPVPAPYGASSFFLSCDAAADDLKFKFDLSESNYDTIIAGAKHPFTKRCGFSAGDNIAYVQAANGAAIVVASPQGW